MGDGLHGVLFSETLDVSVEDGFSFVSRGPWAMFVVEGLCAAWFVK